MNRDEKRAYYSFLAIYTSSFVILISIIAFLYYKNEIKTQNKMCVTSMQNRALLIEAKLLKYNSLNFLHGNSSNVGLFDKDKKSIYSKLKSKQINFSSQIFMQDGFAYFVKKLDPAIKGVSYIVIEDLNIKTDVNRVKVILFFAVFFSTIFIALMGYYLSRLLLKPLKDKIKQIDRFIKDSAHELNTPITALLMSVSKLKQSSSKDDKLLNHISISSKQISQTYNQISHLAFSDISDEDEVIKLDLKKEILKSVDFFKEIAQSKQNKIILDLELFWIKIDQQSVQKIINNLLSNAIKYNKFQKDIKICLKNGILSIKDKGVGIELQNQEEIKKRYIRATSLEGGFGIGLDIVNLICQKYNLSLDIKSQINKGSTFSVNFNAIKCL